MTTDISVDLNRGCSSIYMFGPHAISKNKMDSYIKNGIMDPKLLSPRASNNLEDVLVKLDAMLPISKTEDGSEWLVSDELVEHLSIVWSLIKELVYDDNPDYKDYHNKIWVEYIKMPELAKILSKDYINHLCRERVNKLWN